MVKNAHQQPYSCGGFNTPTLCVVTKGIKTDCNHLIEHTMRNIEHCIYRHGWRLFYAVEMLWQSHNISGKTIHGCIVLTNALRRGC